MKITDNILALHLAKFLDDFEARFDNDPTELSPELMSDYIEAARYMDKNFDRFNNRIKDVFNYQKELTF